MKTCNKCGIIKSLSEFHPDRASRDGHRTICKECTHERIVARRKLRRQGEGIKQVSEKQCNHCLLVKPIGMFFKDIASSDGHYSTCKPCKTAKTLAWRAANKDKYNKSQRDYSKTVPAEQRYGSEIKRRYGCTLDQYNAMLVKQGGRCEICKKLHNPALKKGRLYVDHCHKTGKVRSLLCGACNSALGYFNDDTRVMAEAIAYIIRHRES